jgi:hypothetical protein
MYEIEKGRKQPPADEMVRKIDTALGAGGELVALAEADRAKRRAARARGQEASVVNRRAVLAAGGAAVIGPPASGAIAALAGQLRPKLSVAGWQEVAWRAGFDYHALPRPEFVATVTEDLAALGPRALKATGREHQDLTHAAAELALVLAMACEDLGRSRDTFEAWRLARWFADESEVPACQAMVRAQEATMGLYAGRPLHQLLGSTERGISEYTCNSPSNGQTRLHMARAQVLAWMGRAHEANHSLDDAQRAFDALPAADPGTETSILGLPAFRVGHTIAFVRGAVGKPNQADAALDAALGAVPAGHVISRCQLELHRALRMVNTGDVAGGLSHATTAVTDLPAANYGRFVDALAVRLVDAVPAAQAGTTALAQFTALVASHRETANAA